jgi:hypothetical protein
MSYLIFDAVIVLFFCGKLDALLYQTLMHHFLGMIGYIGALYMGSIEMIISTANLLTELSTPFTNTRAILSTLKVKSGLFFTIIGILFTLSFFVVRVLWQFFIGVYLMRGVYMLTDHPEIARRTGLENGIAILI